MSGTSNSGGGLGRTAALSLAAGGAGVALYLVVKRAQGNVRRSARKGASSPFEYHVAVHVPTSSTTSAGKPSCTLVKIPKTGDVAMLRREIGTALQLEEGIVASMQLFPVLRGSSPGRLGNPLEDASGLEQFQSLLAQQPPEHLQVVELLCALDGTVPSTAPMPPPPFPAPGSALPLLGHTYHVFGKEAVVSYNLTNNVFPPAAPKYPYGPTVRSKNAASQPILDFPEGTVFHKDAAAYTTFTADPCTVQEILARVSEFPKLWNRPSQKGLQDFTGNGLFTSSEVSEDWQSAHSILPRGFNQIKVKSYAPKIFAKTRAFVREWSAFPAGHRVKGVNHWLTSMTADAVVSCSMGLDMNNIERLGQGLPPHPFIDNFQFGLGVVSGALNAKTEYGWKRFIPGFGAKAKVQARYEQSKKELEDLVDKMVEQTRSGDLGGQDSIIRAMMQDKASSGKHVRYGVMYGHIINLMIAGHETTAATLGFTMQLLAEHPECEAKAYAEVRSVLKDRTEPSADDVPKLQYVEQCFREALRLYSPVTVITRDAAYDTVLQGHRIFQGERIGVVNRALHTNPEYWGGEFGDPLSFNPDRFAPEAVKKRHPNAYHPWGFGTRSCIGSQFALFEAKTFLASMLIHFKFVSVPGYKLRASLAGGGAAPSPHELDLIIHPRARGPLFAPDGSMRRLPALSTEASVDAAATSLAAPKEAPSKGPAAVDGPAMQVLYGSNSGASQEFASQTAAAARKAGLNATLGALDQAVKAGLKAEGQLMVVVTSTYNGNPPDNAVKFKDWLSKQGAGALSGMRFAVFGLGNSQWQTYQQFPREVDAALATAGATRAHALGACDVDGASFDTDFEEWLAGLLRAVGGAAATAGASDNMLDEELVQEFTVIPGKVEGIVSDITTAMNNMVNQKETLMKAAGGDVSNLLRAVEVGKEPRELCQKADARSVRHVTLRLPEKHAKYRAGDHLEVLPCNGPDAVSGALAVLGIDGATPVNWDTTKGKGSNRSAQSDVAEVRARMKMPPLTAKLVLEWIPDLTAVPNRKTLAQLAELVKDAGAKEALKAWSADAQRYKDEVASTQVSLLELLQRYSKHLSLNLGQLIALAKPLAPRYYSISSSPEGASDPRLVTVSVGQVEYKTGTGRVHKGLASTTLGNLKPGSVVPGCVRQLAGNFHLPKDLMAPMIMVGPGTGVAPMMGFLQERAALMKQGKKLGPAIMFFGCRRRDEDYIYKDELAAYLSSGVLSELHVAFSRETDQAKVYVQDKIFEQRANVWKLLQQPLTTVYVCGDARAMAPDVKRAFQRVAEEAAGKSQAKAASMIAAMTETGRYLEDVWA